MTLGENIRNLRLKENKTIKDLAAFLNVTEQAVSQYERNIRIPNYSTLNSIADFFNVKVLNLFSEETIKQSLSGLEPLIRILGNKIENSDITWNDIEGFTLEEFIEIIIFLNGLSNKIISKRLSKKMNPEDIAIKKVVFLEGKFVKKISIDKEKNNIYIGMYYDRDLEKQVNTLWESEGFYGAISSDVIDKLDNNS